MRQREPVPLGVPDTYALRRRVLLTGLIAFVLFVLVTFTVTALDVSQAWVIVGLALGYLLVVRPLMRPVREAVKLRRRLAYEAWLADRPEPE